MKLYINPHGMGDRLGPSGLLKASLTEPIQQGMQQSVECYIIHWNLHTKGVSKPSIPKYGEQTFSPLAAKIIKSFCGGRSKNEGWKGRKVEGEKTRRLKRRLKASKPCLSANPHELHNNRHFEVFTADTIQSKKPSVGPKGLIGPPCHGAPLADGGKYE